MDTTSSSWGSRFLNNIVKQALIVFISILCASIAFADDENALPGDLTSIGLRELLSLDLVVTSPGKKEQEVGDVASAVYVLTQEDIRRSGATHIADLLRLVPGVNVAQVAANKWAITIRGFNQVFARRLLVMVDGVSIYSPSINGVYWEASELPLEDIESIEVIRGPGAALWGANAVNGVVNIITKHAKNTQGVLAQAGVGNQEEAIASLRYGGELGEESKYRVYARYNKRGDNELEAGGDANDGWESATGGFRFDIKPSKADEIALQGRGHFHQAELRTAGAPSLIPPFVDDERFSGSDDWQGASGNLKWSHRHSKDFQSKIASNFRYLEQDSAIIRFEYYLSEAAYELQYSGISGHDIVGGLGYRHFRYNTNGSFVQRFDPASRATDLFTMFVQDEIALSDNELFLTLGTKFEHNDSTGFEYMPNARVLWKPARKHSLWAAVSRAISSPATVLEDAIVPAAVFPVDDTLLGVAAIFGDRDVQSEDLLSYELGYRTEIEKQVSFDLALYYNRYSDMVSNEEGEPYVDVFNESSGPVLIVPINIENRLDAEAYGCEATIDWRPASWSRLVASYGFEKVNVFKGDSHSDSSFDLLQDSTPENQFALRSQIDLPYDAEFDSSLRYVDHLRKGDVDSYVELDLRAGIRLSKNIEVSVVGRNLLDQAHKEFVSSLFGPPAIEIRRSVFGLVKIAL
jgi:iron complex outermembrane receptor protein